MKPCKTWPLALLLAAATVAMVYGPPARAQPDSGSRPLESLSRRSLDDPADYSDTFNAEQTVPAVRGAQSSWDSALEFRLRRDSKSNLLDRVSPSLNRKDGDIERASLEFELTDFQ